MIADRLVDQAFFDAYPDAVLLVDPAGRVRRANRAASTLLGYPIEELLELDIEALVPQAVRGRHAGLRQSYHARPAQRPMGLQMELSARRRDGSEVMVEIALSPLKVADSDFVLAAIRGIGEYPRVRQALQRARFAECIARIGRLAVDAREAGLLFEQAPREVAQALEVDGVVLYVPEPDGRMLRVAGGVGLARGEEVGGTLPNRPETQVGHLMRTGSPVVVDDYAAEQRFVVSEADREAGFVSALGVPVSDRGRVVGALVVRSRRPHRFGDDEARFLGSIASLIATVLQRNTSEEALRHSQRLESVGQLSGGIAHDFNNLLTVIQGNLQVLQDLPGLADDALAQELVAAAARASRRGAELTAKLLAFSRRQMLQPRAIDLHAMLPPLATLLSRTLDARVRIELALAADCPPCLADPGQLEAALLNIAINARDAMPEGGTLRFGAERCAVPPAGVDAAAWAAGGVALSVADTGVGMSEAVRARAFEPFFTTKEAGRGTGLGLATVHGFVHQSQGIVTLESWPGTGTTVTLYLPSPPPVADAPGVAARPRDAVPAVPAGLSVLLVEDEPEVLRVVQAFLAQWGCRVVACSHAQGAIDAAALPNARFDLLLSDVVLGPGLRGDQLAQRLREQQPGLPVLLMSGYAEQAQATQWPLLRKPFTRDQLAEAMTAAIPAPPARAG